MAKNIKRLGAVIAAGVLAISACQSHSENPEARADLEARAANVGVQLFQWPWTAIATECTERLGPAGYSWVLTSPPQEHIQGEAWWTHYQPVSYQVESRLGTRAEFAEMVATCATAGVDIIADAVINHMTGQNDPGVGWAGSEYEHYRYPGLYEAEHFHYCGSADNDIHSYQDAYQVQFCELVNLADLDTANPYVQEQIANYLLDLLSLGVAGFRIDAAKHMPAADIDQILSRLPSDTIFYQEVIRGGGEPIQPEDYLQNGPVFEFSWGKEIQPIVGRSSVKKYFDLGSTSIFTPSESALTFVENHDTERNGQALTYRNGDQYRLAVLLTLAHPYGTPVVYSGFAFDNRDAGAPTDSSGRVQDPNCATFPTATEVDKLANGTWLCQHIWPEVAAMVGWANVAANEPITNAWDSQDALAFGRGDRTFLVMNRSPEPLVGDWQTSLPAGDYVDVISGKEVQVGQDHRLSTQVAPYSVLAVQVTARP